MRNKRLAAVMVGMALGLLPKLYAQDLSHDWPWVNLEVYPERCVNPLMESQGWLIFKGKVIEVIDGRTVVVAVQDSRRKVQVQLAGLNLATSREYRERSRERLGQIVLNRSVEVWVNPTVWEKQPLQVTAVMYAPGDAGLSLVASGLAIFAQPPLYTMSQYAECQYRNAEREARVHGIGFWSEKQQASRARVQ
ncbi:MAG TPA: thermonuclease family protein [Candidatus Angelobacter sp.]|jgi:endonuclease YncB( thermonuclease family)|nr:thermonuclease family protein [Candidatus Angelobacter sp.]